MSCHLYYGYGVPTTVCHVGHSRTVTYDSALIPFASVFVTVPMEQACSSHPNSVRTSNMSLSVELTNVTPFCNNREDRVECVARHTPYIDFADLHNIN